MIEAIVVDDEALARTRIRQLLAAHAPDFEIVAECADGVDAIERIRAAAPDVVFLDVQMPEVSGLQVVEELGREEMPLTVFVTAYDRYAVEAFDRHALDYLLKPVADERFVDAIGRVRRALAADDRGHAERVAALADEQRTRPVERILVRRDDSLLFLRTADITRLESLGNYVAVHTAAGKFVHRGTLAAFEQRLDPRRFVRVHRGAIVRIDAVREIASMFGRLRVILHDGAELPLSRRCRRNLEPFEVR